MTTTQEPSRPLATTHNRPAAAIEQRREISLEHVVEMTGYSLPEVALIRHNMAAGMRCKPEDVPFIDIAMFCKATRSLGLDPLVRQAYWISRQGKGGLQIGIDGFRAIADRAGNYAGSSEPVFRGTIDWEHRGKSIVVPEYCQVTTWKIVQGHKCAFTGEARWVEFVPRSNGAGAESDMWAKMPRNQLAKCAEAQSLRKGWALQMGAMELRTDESAEGELPEVAAPVRQIIEEQPRRPAPPASTKRYEDIFGADEDHAYAEGTAQPERSATVDVEPAESPEDVCGARGCTNMVRDQRGERLNDNQRNVMLERYGKILCRDHAKTTPELATAGQAEL